jgi:hypothetical protein
MHARTRFGGFAVSAILVLASLLLAVHITKALGLAHFADQMDR